MQFDAGVTEGEDATAAAVVAEAATRLRAASHLYFELESSERSGVAVLTRHHRPEDVALREYGERFYADDPLTLPFRTWLESGEHHIHRAKIVALGELPWSERTAYESRFLRRAGIADVIGLGVPVTIGGRMRVLCFGFHRRTGEPGFAAAEKRVLARLATGLRLRGENLALREAAALQGEINRALTEGWRQGWILFDDQLQSREAEGMVALRAAGGVHRIQDAFRRWLRSGGLHGANGFRAGADGARFVVDAVRRGNGEDWWLVRSVPALTAVLSETANGTMDLTGREREVACLLVTGNSNPELARELGLKLHTVENHLRSIYHKLGVRSRGQAVALLLNIDRPVKAILSFSCKHHRRN